MADPFPAQGLLNIPTKLTVGDSAAWTDAPFTDSDGVTYDANGYTLKYQLSGVTAMELTATASGKNWITSLSLAVSALLQANTYWWTAQLSATNFRLTVAKGELLMLPDLAKAGANYDGRSLAERALDEAKAALAAFRSSNGRIKSYTIGGRQMQFQTDADALAIVNFWKKEVAVERINATGGLSRLITTRFRRAR